MDLTKLIARDDKIAHLIRGRLPGERQRLKAELSALPGDELDSRYRKAIEDEQEQERLRREREEALRPFNSWLAKAPDYNYWGKLDVWTVDEGISLILGRDPEHAKWVEIQHYKMVSPFAQEYCHLREIAERTASLGQAAQFGMSNLPVKFLEWAKAKELPIPPALEAQVERHAGDVRDWRATNVALTTTIADLKRQSQEALEQRDARIAELQVKIRAAEQAPPTWPWGEYTTPLLGVLSAAGRKWWARYDPTDITTAPKNDDVVAWIGEQPGVSERVAEAMATILRDPKVRTGPR